MFRLRDAIHASSQPHPDDIFRTVFDRLAQGRLRTTVRAGVPLTELPAFLRSGAAGGGGKTLTTC